MRTCRYCGKTAETEAELEGFTKKKLCKHGRDNACKPCWYAYRRGLMDERRAFIDKLKDVPCLDCGNRYPPIAMDFDHVRGEKLFELSWSAAYIKTESAMLAEAEKCDIVCANCHRIRTAA